MKFSIQINQFAAQEGFEDLTISDLSIFDLFSFMNGSTSVIYKIVDNKKYILMHYKYIIGQLPILKIKTRQGVYKKLAKLEEVGLIEKLKEDKKNSDSYYCSGVNYDLMFIKYTDQKVVTPVTTSEPQLPSSNSSCQSGNSSSQGCQPQLPISELELHNKGEEEIYKEEIKESVGNTRSNLNSIQESYGNASVDPLETSLTADVKNKYTNLTPEAKKELWNELRKTIWDYAGSRNWLDDNYPKRWEILELAIKDFVGHHIDKNSFENAFFNYERKLTQWIDKDVLRESSIPYSIWNKTKEDLKGKIKVDSNSDLPNYYDEQLYNSLAGEQLTAYKKKLYKEGYRYDKVKQCWKDRNGRVANGRRLKTKVTSNPLTQHEEEMSKVAKESLSKFESMFEEMGNKMKVNKK